MLFSIVLASAAFTGLAAAQAAAVPSVFPNTTACCTLDPGSVDTDTKSTWCLGETNTCDSACGGFGQAKSNTCDSNTLNYTCVCNDGKSPNMSAYQQSLPAQECLVWVQRCVANAPNDRVGQAFCHSFACGNQTFSASASTSAAAASGSGSAATTGSATTTTGSGSATSAAAQSTSSKAAATALAMAKDYGTPALAAGMLALFGLAL